MATIEAVLKIGETTTEEALKLFDELPPVSTDFMVGRWKGAEMPTGHPMDGLLVPSGWYGKLFLSVEKVHPLLFFTNNKSELYAVNPRHIPLNVQFPKSDFMGTLMHISKPFLQTKEPKARLRMVDYRGKLTATMVYDDQPIFDHFAKIDDNTVLGCMDLKMIPLPYFFILSRDNDTPYKLDF